MAKKDKTTQAAGDVATTTTKKARVPRPPRTFIAINGDQKPTMIIKAGNLTKAKVFYAYTQPVRVIEATTELLLEAAQAGITEIHDAAGLATNPAK